MYINREGNNSLFQTKHSVNDILSRILLVTKNATNRHFFDVGQLSIAQQLAWILNWAKDKPKKLFKNVIIKFKKTNFNKKNNFN